VTFSLHYLRAYHLADILRATTPEDVETVLLNSPEFFSSEKGKGVFVYREPIAAAAEVILMPAAAPEAAESALLRPEEGLSPQPQEMAVETGPTEAAEVITPDEAELESYPRAPMAPPVPSKEKPVKKPKPKPEVEKLPRARKSERKVIEEKIEIEESEQEALIAIKAKEEALAEEAGAETAAQPKPAEETKPPLLSEKPAFSLFAEKLKSALQKKDGKEAGKK